MKKTKDFNSKSFLSYFEKNVGYTWSFQVLNYKLRLEITKFLYHNTKVFGLVI